MIRRHELSDAESEFVRPLLPEPLWRRKRSDDRMVLNGIVRRFGTGVAWRDVPERYAPWATLRTGSVGGPGTARSSGCSRWPAPAFDRQPYKQRNVVERRFDHLKQWRRIATATTGPPSPSRQPSPSHPC
ncbi:transposase [Streptomyces sp. NPDC005921]|uniref:transposase n=1 Tax=Streptomyces sp. NPDC005827 TaxID=3157070 RepID=UPI0033C6E95D